MYYVYLIKVKNPQRHYKTYIGYTNDLKRRIEEHQEKNPELIYYEAYKSEKDARKREQKLKQRGQTVRRLKERLDDSFKINYVLGTQNSSEKLFARRSNFSRILV